MRKPIRIQRKRKKGFKMPPNTVYVGRPSKWGNPFVVGEPMPLSELHELGYEVDGHVEAKEDVICMSAEEALKYYEKMILKSPYLLNMLNELKGKNLACWCRPDEPCHAEILLKLANK
jgi:hypothetical protein